MRTKNKLLAVALFCFSIAFAEPTDSIFVKMPNHLVPSLNAKQRFELAEYAKAGKKDSVMNMFNKKIVLQKYDTAKCIIELQTSESSFLELRKLSIPQYKTPVIGLIQTVYLPLKYSTISFYTENWKLITHTVSLPTLDQWIEKDKIMTSSNSEALIKSILDKKYYSFSFSENNELIVENNVLSTLSVEDKKICSEFLISTPITVKIEK